MNSAKAFLLPDAAGRLRMTRDQASSVRNAVIAAVDYAADQHHLEPDLAAVVRRLASNALEDYPRDESCHGCDFFSVDGDCNLWNAAVPCDKVEAGCDSRQTLGVPF